MLENKKSPLNKQMRDRLSKLLMDYEQATVDLSLDMMSRFKAEKYDSARERLESFIVDHWRD
jgi:hypothetical protein